MHQPQPSVRQLEAAHSDLAAQLAALRSEQNDLAAEQQRLCQFLAKATPRTPGADLAAAREDLATVEKESARIHRAQQQIADRMTGIVNQLSPARETLRTAKRNLAYLETGGPRDPAIVALGARQIAAEQKRLQQLIQALEA